MALTPIQGVDDLIGTLKKDDTPIGLGVQGRMRAFFQRVRAVNEQAKDKMTEKELPPVTVGAEISKEKPQTGEKRKKSEVLDQMDDGTYEPLEPDARKQMRTRHRDVTGGNPLAASRPTAQQLGALKSRVEAGDAPYTDFAVFGPYGSRLSKIRKFEAQVFVDGELKTRILRALPTLRVGRPAGRCFGRP